MPLNPSEKRLYNIIRINETFEVFKVLLDQATAKVGEKAE
jgi:hypothetical protein